MNQNSRTSNVIKNILGGVGGQVFATLLSFVCRTYFIDLLGATYLGVTGLFSNILQMLSLSELGISTAIIYGMYKPIAQGDEKKISKYMNFYKMAYRIIALVVACVGVAIIPFLDFFIKETPDIPENLIYIYVLVLMNTVVSYLYSFKGSLLIADQKNYVTVVLRNFFAIIQNVVQIFVLIWTKNFILYLSVQIITTFLGNYVQALYVDKKYSFLKSYKKEKLEKQEKEELFRNVKGMMLHKLGGFVLNGTDNFIISKFIGLTIVGIYSNYLMIINIVKNYTTLITGSLSASVGNLVASESTEKTYSVYNVILFVHFWIYGFCTVCFYVLFSPFIQLWIGKEFLLQHHTLLFVVMIFYLYGVHRANDTFTNASGIFWDTRKKPIFECIINIMSSIILAKFIGISGVFIGSVIAYFCTGWIEPMYLYKRVFNKKLRNYIDKFSLYFVLTFFTAVVIDGMINNCLINNLLVELFLRLIVVCVGFNGIIYVLFCRTEEFKLLVQYVIKFGGRFKRKKQ